MVLPENFYKNRRLEKLVENQTTFTLEKAEMHVFETHQEAEQVLLKFNQPVLASMVQGKKIMHLQEMQAFDFLPGESIILPADETMCIDFPEATSTSPTRCLAMSISEEKIKHVIQKLNEKNARPEGKEWAFMDYNFHFTNELAIHQILQRLLFIFTEQHPSKDLFADFMLQELIIRVLQSENHKIYNEQSMALQSSDRLAFVIQYIRSHLDQPLSVETLSKKAYMSESNFHRVFKSEMGVSPIEFINNERIKLATSLLHDSQRKIKEIYTECGFNSLSYFIRLFKKKKQLSPKEYQMKLKEQ